MLSPSRSKCRKREKKYFLPADIQKLRAFIAVSIRPNQQVTELMGTFRGLRGARVPKGEEMHITLAFLGDISDIERTDFCRIISDIRFSSFTVSATHIGAFPGTLRARVAYVGVDSPELVGLHSALSAKIPEKYRDKREFVPHLTIARFKVPTDMNTLIKVSDSEDYGKYRVEKLTLYSSSLTPDGAVYKEECSVQLM